MPTARLKLVDTVEKIDSRFMTLPTKVVSCVRDGGQLWEPTGRPDRYNSKAEATLKCCSATSNKIPLGHDSNIAHLVGHVLPKVNILSSEFPSSKMRTSIRILASKPKNQHRPTRLMYFFSKRIKSTPTLNQNP